MESNTSERQVVPTQEGYDWDGHCFWSYSCATAARPLAHQVSC